MQYSRCMRPVQCYFWFIYVYLVLSLQNCSYLLLLIAGWLGAYGSTFWQPSLIIIAVVLTVVALVMDYLALYGSPSTVSQVCFFVYSC